MTLDDSPGFADGFRYMGEYKSIIYKSSELYLRLLAL